MSYYYTSKATGTFTLTKNAVKDLYRFTILLPDGVSAAVLICIMS
ncbi:MAG TPA: hypothetical protein VE223_06080 [Nitrososphaeraceae archaeon]|nr:hypothetical protein [Nitrososphaeraceae archaeon]